MNYDMDMCAGHRDNAAAMCPLRDRCKRYILGRKAVSEHYYPIWWISPSYMNGECKYFIEVKEETK